MRFRSMAIAVGAVALAGTCLRAGTPVEGKAAERLRRAGGLVVANGTFTGKILIADAQERVAHSNAVAVAAALTEASGCNVVAERARTANPAEVLKGHGADVAVVVVDDKDAPGMLLAPDERWGVVNVAKMVDDLPGARAKAKFLPSRVRKQVTRAFSVLCGGASSSFPGNAMNAMSPRELDFAGEGLPIDKVDAIQIAMRRIGITPRRMMTYAKACAEGIAPEPTNDVQRAIWEETHRIPDKPLEIKFDKTKGK